MHVEPSSETERDPEDKTTMTDSNSEQDSASAATDEASKDTSVDKLIDKGNKEADAERMDVETTKDADDEIKTCFDLKTDLIPISEVWRQLDKDSKDSTKGFEYADRAKKGEGSIIRLMNHATRKIENPKSIEEWQNLFRSNINKKRNSKRIFSLALNLAATKPEYFPPANWVGSKLLAVDEAHTAWAAAQTIFGSVFQHMELIFDSQATITPLTPAGIDFVKLKNLPPGFVFEELFLDNETSFHNLARKCKKLVQSKYKSGPSSAEWEYTVKKFIRDPLSFDQEIRDDFSIFIQKVWRTDPKEFRGMQKSGGRFLHSNSYTSIWAALYRLFGCGWSEEVTKYCSATMVPNIRPSTLDRGPDATIPGSPMEEDSSQSHKTDLSQQNDDSSIGNHSISQSTVSALSDKSIGQQSIQSILRKRSPDSPHLSNTGRSGGLRRAGSPHPSKGKKRKTQKNSSMYFLNKPMPKKTSTAPLRNALHGKKHLTYIKVKLPFTWQFPNNTKESEEEVKEKISKLIEMLFEIDSRALLIPWNPVSKMKPISHAKFEGIPSKAAAVSFFDNLFPNQDRPAYLRLKMVHDSSPHSWDEPDIKQRFRNEDMFIGVDKIQAQKISCAGWFLGSHRSMDSKALEECLSQHPKLKNIQLEIRWQAIKLDQSQRINPKDIIRASHIHTDKESVAKVRSTLNAIYGHRNEGFFPLGKVMRFIPNLADPTFIRTPAIVANAVKCVTKQKVFVESVTTVVTYNVDSVDYIPRQMDPPLSLREACMKILRPDKEDHASLFISIDTSFRGEITFLVKTEIAHQARAIINTLPVIMHHKYGPQAMQWFPQGSEHMLTQFKWDPISKTVQSLEEDDHLMQDDKLWEHDEGTPEPITIDESYQLMDPSLEVFPVLFADEVPSHRQYNDDRESVVTFGPICHDGEESTNNADSASSDVTSRSSIIDSQATSYFILTDEDDEENLKPPATDSKASPKEPPPDTAAITSPPVQDIQEQATMVSAPNSTITSEPTLSEETITAFLKNHPDTLARLISSATQYQQSLHPSRPNAADVTPDKNKHTLAPTREGKEEE